MFAFLCVIFFAWAAGAVLFGAVPAAWLVGAVLACAAVAGAVKGWKQPHP